MNDDTNKLAALTYILAHRIPIYGNDYEGAAAIKSLKIIAVGDDYEWINNTDKIQEGDEYFDIYEAKWKPAPIETHGIDSGLVGGFELRRRPKTQSPSGSP